MFKRVTPGKKDLPMWILFVIVFLDLLGVSLAVPVLAPLFLDVTGGVFAPETTFAHRTLMYGFIMALYPLMQFFGAPIIGAWSERVGRRKALLVSLLGTVIGHLMFAVGIITASLPVLLFARALDGFTGGNISVVYSVIADVSTKANQVVRFGIITVAFGLGFIIGPVMGGVMSDPSYSPLFNFATPFWVASIFAFGSLLITYFVLPETSRGRINTPMTYKTGFLNIKKGLSMEDVRVPLVTSFLLMFGYAFFVQFFAVFLVDRIGLGQSAIGFLFAYIGVLVTLVQVLLVKPVSKWFKSAEILVLSLIILSIGMFLVSTAGHVLLIYIVMPILALGMGLSLPNITGLVSQSADEESQGEIMGIQQSLQAVSVVVPPMKQLGEIKGITTSLQGVSEAGTPRLISGFAISFGTATPLVLAGTMVGVAWLYFLVSYKKPEKIFHEV